MSDRRADRLGARSDVTATAKGANHANVRTDDEPQSVNSVITKIRLWAPLPG
jgi:hypothetical protein